MLNKKFKKFSDRWLRYKLDYVSLFLLMLAQFGRLQINNYFGDGDGFYHAKMTLFLRDGIILKNMPWMQFSSLRDNFTDHQLIYHLILVPFTYLNANPLIGIKIATALFATLMVITLYWLLKKTGVIWPWIFAGMMASFEAIILRLSLIKVNSLSLIVIWFLMYAIFYRKIWLTAILSFIFVWLYAGWPLAIFITLLYIFSEWLYHKIHSGKLRFAWHQIIHVFGAEKKQFKMTELLLAMLIGISLALILSPYWPNNLSFYYQQFVQIGVINLGTKMPVGNEWYGVNPMTIISYAPLLFIVSFITFFLLSFGLKRVGQKTWFSFILTFTFLLLTIKSRRYVEYYIPFALLFSAYGITDLVKMINWVKVKKLWSELSLSIKTYLFIAILILVTMVMPGLYHDLLNPSPYDRWTMDKYVGAAKWLQANTPEHSLVFNNMWDDWGLFFYHNDHNYYIIGLDPTFMYNYDPKLTEKYFDITLYQDETKIYTPNQVAGIIKNDFKSNYVVIEKSKPYEKFIKMMQGATSARQRYEDDKTVIFELL